MPRVKRGQNAMTAARRFSSEPAVTSSPSPSSTRQRRKPSSAVSSSPTSAAGRRNASSRALDRPHRRSRQFERHGYSQLIHGLQLGGLDLDRKILAELAVNDPARFTALTDSARGALTKTAAA